MKKSNTTKIEKYIEKLHSEGTYLSDQEYKLYKEWSKTYNTKGMTREDLIEEFRRDYEYELRELR